MVGNPSHQFLREEHAGKWTRQLQEKYRKIKSNSAQYKRLQMQAKSAPRPFSRVLKDLDTRKETYVLIRVFQDKPAQYSLSQDIPARIEMDLKEHCDNIVKVFRRDADEQEKLRRQQAEAAAQSQAQGEAAQSQTVGAAQSSEHGFEEIIKKGVRSMRSALSQLTKKAYQDKTGDSGSIPWGQIIFDSENASAEKKGPGFFEPHMLPPHKLNRNQCVKMFESIIQNEGKLVFRTHAESDHATNQSLGASSNGMETAEVHANEDELLDEFLEDELLEENSFAADLDEVSEESEQNQQGQNNEIVGPQVSESSSEASTIPKNSIQGQHAADVSANPSVPVSGNSNSGVASGSMLTLLKKVPAPSLGDPASSQACQQDLIQRAIQLAGLDFTANTFASQFLLQEAQPNAYLPERQAQGYAVGAAHQQNTAVPSITLVPGNQYNSAHPPAMSVQGQHGQSEKKKKKRKSPGSYDFYDSLQ
ncbi:hypothetical protein BOX15_Mlig014902g1 [Macrostomum lignano]|uniref:Uncharacterized protein n=1 Tax=Macrostomum lignano TaxID=282301 RepID=A0A267GZW5_9PLAT|nr:hypothetical protein BOX15_Mlig014902g1 [Macrostomum lignano]